MSQESDLTPEPRYVVFETDTARAERDSVFTYLLPLLGPRVAADWYDGLGRAVTGLAEFPGPLSHPIDDEATSCYGYEVRRLLYKGPKHRANFGYRVLFTILRPPPDEPETTICVIRVLHTARPLVGDADE